MTPPTEDEVRAWLEAMAGPADPANRWYRAALALLDEARKDKERLDWLEASGCYVTTSDVDFTPAPLPNLRAAIDQARGA